MTDRETDRRATKQTFVRLMQLLCSSHLGVQSVQDAQLVRRAVMATAVIKHPHAAAAATDFMTAAAAIYFDELVVRILISYLGARVCMAGRSLYRGR